MPYDITDPAAAHRLQLEGREKLTVSGVEDVERFDDQCIVLRTGAGVLVVSGESLHIGKLSLDGGFSQKRKLANSNYCFWPAQRM